MIDSLKKRLNVRSKTNINMVNIKNDLIISKDVDASLSDIHIIMLKSDILSPSQSNYKIWLIGDHNLYKKITGVFI